MPDPNIDRECPACWHLWSMHGPGGCTAKVYPAHSLTGEPCPCEHASPETDPVTGQARKRAAELSAMAEDENWLGI